MKQATYISGNDNKAKYFSKMTGLDIPHQKVDVDEIQSLDPRIVAEHKARQAYDIIQSPVLVEDTSLSFDVLGRLPGTLIKWFYEEIGLVGMCRLLDNYDNRGATASTVIAYYDGHELTILEGSLHGQIADKPRGDSSFGWNAIFIPDGDTRTFGEMSEAEFEKYYLQVKPFDQLREFLSR